MALPKIATPTFDLTLPVSKKQITFRPFLVKEQKILLMALESNDKDTIQSNIKHVLSNCLLTDLDVDTLPVVDVEYYFLNLRARSIGEVIDSKYRCENIVDEKKCNALMETQFNILDIQVEMPKDISDKIMLTDKIGVKLKYPNYNVVDKIQSMDNATDVAFELILDCIEFIFDDDSIYFAHETPREEMVSFMESLTKDQFDKIQEFTENLPRLKKELNVKCPKCGYEHKIDIEGLESFF